MTRLSVSVVLAVAVAVAACVAASDVVVLEADTFDEVTGASDEDGAPFLVEFYAPWCGHCKNLAPAYEKVATELKGTVGVGKIDATAHRSVMERFGVKGFPTMGVISGGRFTKYGGQRSVEALVAFAEGGFKDEESVEIPNAKAAAVETENSGPSDVVVLTDETFEKETHAASASADNYLVEFYAPWCGHCKNLAPTYEKVATALKGEVGVAKVDATENPESAKRFGVKGFPTVVLLSGGKYYSYSGARTQEALVEFAKNGQTTGDGEDVEELEGEMPEGPTKVIELTDETFELETQATTGSTTGDWLVEFYAPWCGHCKKLAPTYERVARELEGEINVARVDATANRQTARRFNIKGYPTVLFISARHSYLYEGGRKTSDMVAFAKEGWKAIQQEGVDILPNPTYMQSLYMDMGEEFKQLKSDLTTLVSFKLNALIVVFSAGAIIGVLLAFGLFAALGGLSPTEVEYVEVPAEAAATTAAAPAGADADADAAGAGAGAGAGAAGSVRQRPTKAKKGTKKTK